MKTLRSILRFNRSKSRRQRLRSRRHNTLAAAQALEVRSLLAGNVLAAVSADGDLTLTGDDQANAVDVTIENGNVVVRGRDNTTINGAADDFVAFQNSTSIADDFFARLGNGDDELFVQDVTISGRASVHAHAGNDSIGFDSTSVGQSLGILGGRGADVVNLEDVQVGRDFVLYAGRDNNTVRVANSTITRDVWMFSGRHDDSIVLDTVTVGDDLRVFTGAGADDLVIQDSTIRHRLRAVTGRGNDFVMMDGTAVSSRAVVHTNGGTDQVVVEDSSSFKRLIVRTGTGSDAAEIDSSTIIGKRLRVRQNESGTVSATERDTQLNAADTGALTRANAAAAFFNGLGTMAPLSLSVDVSSNGATQSSDTLVTNDPAFELAVTTQPGATVNVDTDADGQFDDGTTTADASGQATLMVNLTHTDANLGANVLNVQATNGVDTPLTEEFNVHLAEGTVVRFDSSLGTWDVELLDDDAPNTVGAFLDDLSRYDDTIVHREIDDFIIQGGGFSVNGTTVVDVPDFGAPPNEGNAVTPQNRNVRGTISTAQTSNVNSFTGQWFFNTVDNANLDNVPHAVFGRVIGTGMTVVDAINDVQNFNVTNRLTNAGALTHVPLVNYTAGDVPVAANFVQINSVTELVARSNSENTFRLFENSDEGTIVGTVEAPAGLTDPLIYEFDAPATPTELRLNPDDHLDGNAAAPVVLVEYISLQCPACAAVAPDVEQLLADNAADLLVVRRHLPNDTSSGGGFEHSFEAALAAEAAGRQGMFDEMVSELFQRQGDWTNSVTSQQAHAVFEDIAVNTLGLNLTQFNSDMNDQALTDRINRDIAGAANLGISATPTFFLNGQQSNSVPTDSAVQAAVQSLDPTFLLDRRTGQLTVVDNADLNFEADPSFTLDINVTNGSTQPVQATVNLIDIFAG